MKWGNSTGRGSTTTPRIIPLALFRAAWTGFALSLLLSPHVPFAQESGGRLVYSERQPLLGFEPIVRNNVSTTRFCSMIFEQLLDRKRVGIGLECRLCESYTATDKLITFLLKKNIKWHDGLPLTARDVVFSFQAVTHPETGSALAKELDNIDDASVVDDYTATFSLKQPVALPEAYFLALPILPAHKFEAFEPPLELEPDLGKVREVRVHNIRLLSEARSDARLVAEIPIGAQINVVAPGSGWVRVKVIGRGPVGKEGWVEQHVPIITAKTNPDFLVGPVGTGPYKFTSATMSGDANLKCFEGYHGKRAFIDQVRRARSSDAQTMITRLTSEIVDLIPETPIESLPRIVNSGVARAVPYPSLKFVGLIYNVRHPLLAHKAFRQALTYASNRKQWLTTFYQNEGSLIAGPASPDSWLYDSRILPYPYDVRKAKELLGSVTKARDITLNLVVSNDRISQDYAMLQAFSDSLKGLGVTIKVTVMEPAVFAETMQSGNFEIALQEWSLSYGYNFRPLFEPDGVLNHGRYKNDELGKIFAQWRVETDFEKIRELAYQSQVILADDCPYTFLWSLKSIAAVNNKVRRISQETIDPFRFFAWVHLWWIPAVSQ